MSKIFFLSLTALGLLACGCGSKSDTKVPTPSGLDINANTAGELAKQAAYIAGYEAIAEAFLDFQGEMKVTLDKEAFLAALEKAARDPKSQPDMMTMGKLMDTVKKDPKNAKAIVDLSAAFGTQIGAYQHNASVAYSIYIDSFIEGAKDGVYGKPAKYTMQ